MHSSAAARVRPGHAGGEWALPVHLVDAGGDGRAAFLSGQDVEGIGRQVRVGVVPMRGANDSVTGPAAGPGRDRVNFLPGSRSYWTVTVAPEL